MTLIEALKSGRRFRREGLDWQDLLEGYMTFDVAYILAEDWEIEPLSVTITDTQFWDAYKKALVVASNRPAHELTRGGWSYRDQDLIINELMKGLGLK